MSESSIKDTKSFFRAAYENRYTWDESFRGYKGRCIFQEEDRIINGSFSISSDLTPILSGIDDEPIRKAIASQLWEVAIHRVRRTFEETHGLNTFEFGDINDIGTEIIIGGKNKGDRYRVKDKIVTMVHRHIHGNLISIITKKTINTGKGYLSKLYTSQYFDPATLKPIKPLINYEDTFKQLEGESTWVLAERIVDIEQFKDLPSTKKIYKFEELQAI